MCRNALFALVVGAALAAIGIRVTSAPNATATATSKAPLTPAGFSHPLVLPPVNTNANVSIGINEVCVQILDGPCTNMWTYGGTYQGLTIRRPTGQRTYVAFTNGLDPLARYTSLRAIRILRTPIRPTHPDSTAANNQP